jgi:hypothetical protein
MSTIRYETPAVLIVVSAAVTSGRNRSPQNRKTIGPGGLRWRCLAVGKNFRNGRRKLIHSRAGNNDAIPTAVSFLGDTQEPASLIFPELDVEVLALNLQFSGLDDVIHFCLKGAEFREPKSEMEAKSAGFREFIIGSPPGEKEVAKPLGRVRQRGRVAVLPAQPRLWCALILLRLACHNPLILVPIRPQTLNGRLP